MRAPVTLLDVARAAGVSKSTAANVFSRPEKVRPELRGLVQAAARELDYSGPDARGRLLSLGHANAIGIVAPADAGFAWIHSHPFMQEFLTGVSEVCDERGCGLLLISARNPDGSSGVGNAIVDGMILGTVAQAELIEPGIRRRMPFLVLNADGGEDMNSISFDEPEGVRKLVRHLLQLGHRRFAFASANRSISGPIMHVPGAGRPGLVVGYEQEWQAYRAAAETLAEAGLSMDDMPSIEANGSAHELLNFGDFTEPFYENLGGATAVVSLNHDLTRPLLLAAQRRGIAVPDRLSVAGLKHQHTAAATTPELTAIVQPISNTERGRIAARILFENPRPPQHLLLPTELVIGGSTGPAQS